MPQTLILVKEHLFYHNGFCFQVHLICSGVFIKYNVSWHSVSLSADASSEILLKLVCLVFTAAFLIKDIRSFK